MPLSYYDIAGQASRRIGNHPGLLIIRKLCIRGGRILDVGCGEGSRLNTLLPKTKSGWGIDISPSAIKKARKQYPGHHFRVADATSLPFSENYFDLAYSAFAIEHSISPEQFILEMYRVVKPGGYLIILTPNYGAPNRRSPVSIQNPYTKFISGLINDFRISRKLNWVQVSPKSNYTQIDDDTRVEPYLHSLLGFASNHHLSVINYSSLWGLENISFNPRKLAINIFGRLNIFPFKYWGPQLFVIIRK